MTRLELPDGAWAELADPRKVPERKRRKYIAAMTDLASSTAQLPRSPTDPSIPDETYLGSTQLKLADEVSDMLIVCVVTAWSFGDVSADTISDLPADAFDILFRACRDLADQLVPVYGNPVPKVSTESSSRSPTTSSMGVAASATNGTDGTS